MNGVLFTDRISTTSLLPGGNDPGVSILHVKCIVLTRYVLDATRGFNNERSVIFDDNRGA